MAVPTQIIGGNNHNSAEVVTNDGVNGLVVFTTPLRRETSRYAYATNSTLGIDMNVNASFGGTPVPVHDGTDAVQWTANILSGSKWVVDSTDVANTGTKSVKSNGGNVGNALEFDKGSTIDLSSYTAVTMAVYVASGWDAASADSVEFGACVPGTVAPIGTPVKLEDYISETATGSWQNVVIPLSDLGLSTTTIQSFCVSIVAKSGHGPVFYLDDIQVEETGGSKEFAITARPLTKFHMTSYHITMSDNITAVTWNKFMGLTKLTNGVRITRTSSLSQGFDATVRDISELVSLGANIETNVADATDSLVSFTVNLSSPILMDSKTRDTLTITVSDDLSGLNMFRFAVLGIEEF